MSESPVNFDPCKAVEVFREAARQNYEDSAREGSIFRLPGYGQVVATGDLHGNHTNLTKLQRYAALERWPARHVILHEMVHSETHDREIDHSHEVLLRAAEYKCEFPDQVHFLQSNHELAQLTGYPIAKNGRAVIEDFNNSVEFAYGSDKSGEVLEAINEFIASFGIAVRTENRVWMSHSLPNSYDMDSFDVGNFDRRLEPEDLADHGPVFKLVWGRRHTSEQIEQLAETLKVDIFVLGHQPQENGYDVRFDRLIILASDHNHGTFLPIDLHKRPELDALIANIRKFVAVA